MRLNNRNYFILTLTLAFVGFGCAKKNGLTQSSSQGSSKTVSAPNDNSTSSETEASTNQSQGPIAEADTSDDVIDTFSFVTDASTGSVPSHMASSSFTKTSNLAAPTLPTGACFKLPTMAKCENGKRQSVYDNCSFSGASWSGKVDLSYSSPTCAFEVGDSVAGLANMDFAFKKWTAQVSTDLRKDYRGISIGGGAEATRMDKTHYSVVIPGANLKMNGTIKDKVIAKDHFVRTLNAGEGSSDPLVIELDRENKTAGVDGTIEIVKNHKKQAVVVTYNEVRIDKNKCCIPFTGNVHFESTTGTKGTITFTSTCGLIEKDINGNKSSEQIQCK